MIQGPSTKLLAAATHAAADSGACTRAQEQWRGEVARLSWQPRAYVLKGFLSDAEADHIISLVRRGLTQHAARG